MKSNGNEQEENDADKWNTGKPGETMEATDWDQLTIADYWNIFVLVFIFF